MPNKVMEPDLIIYGGAFNPPHKGHFDCVQAVSNKFSNAKIHIFPGNNPAGSKGQHKFPSISFRDRLKMCELTFRSLSGERVYVSDLESKLSSPNFSINLLERMKLDCPDSELGFVMGFDQFQSFSGWYQYLQILKIANLVVIKRDHFYEVSSAIENVAKNLKVDVSWEVEGEVMLVADTGKRIFLLDVETSEASSTMIRDMIRKEGTVSASWLDESVLQYILENKFYL